MKTVIYKASSRGHRNHGWLNTYHTFSFADYYNPKRINFGMLRVLNDDWIEGGKGFGMHPHDNMEIITIPLDGDLEHQDSMGNRGVISAGDVQVMSAGSGILHSEFNASQEKPVSLFQIWILSNKKNVTPRYQQIKLDYLKTKNKFQQIVSPNEADEGLWIHQNAWFNIGTFDESKSVEYRLKSKNNGVFLMVIDGRFSIDGQILESRDGLGIIETEFLNIKSESENSKILLMDIPMF